MNMSMTDSFLITLIFFTPSGNIFSFPNFTQRDNPIKYLEDIYFKYYGPGFLIVHFMTLTKSLKTVYLMLGIVAIKTF